MEGKTTIYEENITLHRTSKQFSMVRDFVISRLLHESFPKMDRDLCVLLDIDYDEIMEARGRSNDIVRNQPADR